MPEIDPDKTQPAKPAVPAKPAKKTAAKKTTPARRKISLEEKAREALRIEQARVDTLQERTDRLTAELQTVTMEHAAAVERRDFLALDPALKNREPVTHPTTGPGA